MVEQMHSLLTFDMTEEEKSIFEKRLKEKHERNFKGKARTVKNRTKAY